MRREHRHEHFFLRVLHQLACQQRPWSAEDRRRFATDAREFTQFLRSHMDHERRDLFEQAARSLPAQTKRLLAQAFVDFDAKQQVAMAAAHGRVERLLLKYGLTQMTFQLRHSEKRQAVTIPSWLTRTAPIPPLARSVPIRAPS